MKNIRIGAWDGEQVLIQVQDEATVSDALRTAGLQLAQSQSVTTFSDAQDVELNSLVRDGETYLLTGNQVSGSLSFSFNQVVNGVNFMSRGSLAFGKLFSYRFEDRRAQFSSILFKMGIKSVIREMSESLDKHTLFFPELTMICAPVNIIGTKNDSEKETFNFNKLELLKYQTLELLEQGDERIRITTTTNKVVADYYKNRNLIICYVNIFLEDPRIRVFSEVIDLIFSRLSSLIQIQNVDSKLKEINSKVNLTAFTTSLRNEVVKLNNDIEYNINSIQNYSKSILEYEKKRIVLSKTREAIDSLLQNFESEFETKIGELKELTFLKSFSIRNGFILLDYGEIIINVKNKEKENDYYIGNIVAEIYPDRVIFKNINNAHSSGVVHPHINAQGYACFGTFASEISKLLASLQLKKLAILIRQFLYTWNPDSPIAQITNWKNKPFSEYNKKEVDLTTNTNTQNRATIQTINNMVSSLTRSQREEFIRKIRSRK